MKKLQFWSLMVGLVFGSLAFVACGDDDDDDNSNSGGASSGVVTGDLNKDVIGKWYLTETSDKKVLVNIIEFKADKTGTFGEYKAKADYNWRIEGGEAPFTYTISGKRVTMTATNGDKTEVREGDVVMNSDGTATVTAIENGKTGNTMTMRRVTNQTAESLMQELLKDKQEQDINSQIVGNWKWGVPNMPEQEEHRSAGYEFKRDGSCMYYEREYMQGQDQNILMYELLKYGNYSINGTNLSIRWTSGSSYDGGSGVKHELDEGQLGEDKAEAVFSKETVEGVVYSYMSLRRYYDQGGRQGYSEEGPFYKVQ